MVGGMIALTLVAFLYSSAVPAPPTWEAPFCFTQKHRRTRTFIGACQQSPVDYEAFCEPHETYFVVRTTPKPTEEECQALVDMLLKNRKNVVFIDQRVAP